MSSVDNILTCVHLRIICLALAVLLLGACSSVRQAPVEERQEQATAQQAPVEPVAAPAAEQPAAEFPAGEPLVEENQEQWVQLPHPDDADETGLPAQAQRPSDNPAVLALLDDADVHVSEDNPDGAADAIERTLRLEPKNPWLWHRLAVLKLEQGNWRQAVALAQKSNSLSARHPSLRRANADLITQAKKHGEGLE